MADGSHRCICQVLIEERRALGKPVEALPKLRNPPHADSADCPVFLAELYRGFAVERDPAVALCLSGGGIRSATFGLGVLQGLAEAGVLPRIDYLSTVSGGGYIGSWLSGWIHRNRDSQPTDETAEGNAEDAAAAGVFEALRCPPGDSAPGLFKEPTPIRFLRDFTSYLAPQQGLFSADTWTLVATYLRNLLLNWLVILPVLFLLLLVPRLLVPVVSIDPRALPGWLPDAALVLGLGLLLTAIAYMAADLPSNLGGSDVRGRPQSSFVKYCLAPLIGGCVCLEIWVAWRVTGGANDELRLWCAVGGGIAMLIATSLTFVPAAARLLAPFGRAPADARRPTGQADPGSMSTARRAESSAANAAHALGIDGFGIVIALCAATLLGAGVGTLIATLLTASGSLAAMRDFPGQYVCLAGPAFLAILGFSGAIFNGGLSYFDRPADDEDREWWARAGGWLTIAILGWLGLAALSLFGPIVVLTLPKVIAGLTASTGLATILLGKSGATPAAKKAAPDGGGLPGVVSRHLLTIGAPLFAALLLALMALALDRVVPLGAQVSSDWLPVAQDEAQEMVAEIRAWEPALPQIVLSLAPSAPAASERTPVRMAPRNGTLLLCVAGGLVVIGVLASWLIDTDRFSLHAMYRNRLIRAYLGASRNDERRPNRFTGFDPRDNFQLHELSLEYDENHAGETLVQRPLHVLGMALNVCAGERLAWQERKAMPFSSSALHSGTHFLGYRPTRGYDREYGISIGTALAVSGAAANPNMGYNSSPVVSFLLTLFNVRLGVWMQNPGPSGDAAGKWGLWRLSGFRMLGELFGLSDRSQQVVNLSDGGHFDNLGLYEMVMRRCRLILVSDAGCDPECQFEDLAIALHKIRVDLGVEIEFLGDGRIPIDARAARRKRGEKRVAIARILYSARDGSLPADDGWLVYMKPTVYGSEPIDVQNYAAQNPAFPHESTVDQFFGESQFESYRRLGRLTAHDTIVELRGAGCPGGAEHNLDWLRTFFAQPPAQREAA